MSSCTLAGGAADDVRANDAGVQAIAINTGAAVEGISRVILSVVFAPYSCFTASTAQMNRCLLVAVGHYAQGAVTDWPKFLANVANRDPTIRSMLVAH